MGKGGTLYKKIGRYKERVASSICLLVIISIYLPNIFLDY